MSVNVIFMLICFWISVLVTTEGRVMENRTTVFGYSEFRDGGPEFKCADPDFEGVKVFQTRKRI